MISCGGGSDDSGGGGSGGNKKPKTYDFEYTIDADSGSSYAAIDLSSDLDFSIVTFPTTLTDVSFDIGTTRLINSGSPVEFDPSPDFSNNILTIGHVFNANSNDVYLSLNGDQLTSTRNPDSTSDNTTFRNYLLPSEMIAEHLITEGVAAYHLTNLFEFNTSYAITITSTTPSLGEFRLASGMDGGTNDDGNPNFTLRGITLQPNGDPSGAETQRLMEGDVHELEVEWVIDEVVEENYLIKITVN